MIMSALKQTSPHGLIITVNELHKWTGKNVNQLFSDISTHKDK